jgi:hypothetical protein
MSADDAGFEVLTQAPDRCRRIPLFLARAWELQNCFRPQPNKCWFHRRYSSGHEASHESREFTKSGERRRTADGSERLRIDHRRMPIDQAQGAFAKFVKADWRWRHAVVGLHLRQQLAGRTIIMIVRIFMLGVMRSIGRICCTRRFVHGGDIAVTVRVFESLVKEKSGPARPEYERGQEKKFDPQAMHCRCRLEI